MALHQAGGASTGLDALRVCAWAGIGRGVRRAAERRRLKYSPDNDSPSIRNCQPPGAKNAKPKMAHWEKTNDTSEGPMSTFSRFSVVRSEHRILVRLRRIGAPTAVPLVPAVQSFSRTRVP
jgi:hypothetical protein